jgi:pyruvate ferredoxin oxidoreductase gamma subunit
MFRIRFHGRGGQGMKTASRVLGSAFFAAGYEVQDAPRYGAERRGAPIFAYVRAARAAINERGVIGAPDLVVVADDSLVGMPSAGVMQGVSSASVLLFVSDVPAQTWRERLNFGGTLLTLAAPAAGRGELPLVGARCTGAAARLLGAIPPAALDAGLQQELGAAGAEVLARNREAAQAGWEALAAHAGCVGEGQGLAASDARRPEWIELPSDPAELGAPAIHAAANSVEVRTGLWRTLRPVPEPERCKRCWWVCSAFCPDSAISVTAEGTPEIDYEHCKGCLICVAQCPSHAIRTVPESGAAT